MGHVSSERLPTFVTAEQGKKGEGPKLEDEAPDDDDAPPSDVRRATTVTDEELRKDPDTTRWSSTMIDTDNWGFMPSGVSGARMSKPTSSTAPPGPPAIALTKGAMPGPGWTQASAPDDMSFIATGWDSFPEPLGPGRSGGPEAARRVDCEVEAATWHAAVRPARRSPRNHRERRHPAVRAAAHLASRRDICAASAYPP